MKTFLKFATFIFISCFIFSCSTDSNVSFYDSSNNITEKRSNCNDEQVDRLVINANYSMIVTHCYDQGTLIDVDYEISARMMNDIEGALDLSQGDNSPLIHVFNRQINSLNYSGNLYISFHSGAIDEDDDFCECNDANPEVSDCVKEEYRKIRSCSGNFCGACSLVMVFFTSSGETHTITNSVVKLPTNF